MPVSNSRTKRHYGRSRYASKYKGHHEKKYSLVKQPCTGPMRIFRKLRYVSDDLELSPGTAAAVGHVYRLNGLYDPDLTGSGNQPRGFDQYCNASGGLYRNYTVLGARITVQFMNLSSTTYTRAILKISRSGVIDADPIDALEKRIVRTTILGPYTGGSAVKTMSLNWSAKNWFGQKSILSDTDYAGNSGAMPNKQAYLHVMADPIGEAGSAGFRAVVKMDFLVCFRTPTLPPQS